jgi:hypothetical protein
MFSFLGDALTAKNLVDVVPESELAKLVNYVLNMACYSKGSRAWKNSGMFLN